MHTSNSTLTVARVALRAAKAALPDYAHRKSPKKFTQPQLVVCLHIKEFLGLDYRSLPVLLAEWSELRQVLGLTRVPHFTTLCAAAKRLLRKAPATALLGATLHLARRAKLLAARSPLAAIDSTGLEAHHVSAYYVRRCRQRKGHRRRRYPKLSAVCDTATHLVLGAVADRGPKPDLIEAEATLLQALGQQPVSTLLGDAGYESERFHCFCRDERGIRSIIPTRERGRPRADRAPRNLTGDHRRQMHRRFPKKTYGQRWQIETVFSMLKRNLGSALRAHHYQSQVREILARVLTHNVMILILPSSHVLYRAVPVPIFPRYRSRRSSSSS